MRYTPDLVTLDAVRQHRRLKTSETGNDELITSLIHAASTIFQGEVDRVCAPYYGTHTFDAVPPICRPYTLDVGKAALDLLSVTTLTNGNGVTISGAGIALRTSGFYPKWRVELKQSAGATFTYNTDWQDAISVLGWWGYVPSYDTCWRDSGVDVPVGGLTSGGTTVTLASAEIAALFPILGYLKIDDEIMQVTGRSGAVLTITRSELGTTAASHLAGAAVNMLALQADIVDAVRELVAYAYKALDRTGGTVKVYDGGVVTMEGLDKSVGDTIQRHRRKLVTVL